MGENWELELIVEMSGSWTDTNKIIESQARENHGWDRVAKQLLEIL